jgi:tetratricopeptide (TPR) repeat protein
MCQQTSRSCCGPDHDCLSLRRITGFREAIRLNPGATRARLRFGRVLARIGRHQESIRELRTAVNLDPLSEASRAFLAEALFFARKYDESVRKSLETLELFPESWQSHLNLDLVYAAQGKLHSAIDEYKAAMALNRDNPTLG